MEATGERGAREGAGGAAPGTAPTSGGGPRARFLRLAAWTITDELPAAASFLPEEERAEFTRYYRNLPAPAATAAIRLHLRGLWRLEAGWVARWIEAFVARHGRAPHVVDAGCGFGTYAMLFACAGARVTGVDLRPDRLSAAERRLGFHAVRTGERLEVRYVRADLTREWPGRCDLVWVYNALSHIDPLEAFLEATRRHLDPGGVLVVGDLNGANPAHRRRLEQVRGEVHQEYVAPDGRRHAYAVERTFAPGELRAILAAAGLPVTHHELYWPGQARAPEALHRLVYTPLQRAWWLGGPIARRQLVVGSPAPAGGA